VTSKNYSSSKVLFVTKNKDSLLVLAQLIQAGAWLFLLQVIRFTKQKLDSMKNHYICLATSVSNVTMERPIKTQNPLTDRLKFRAINIKPKQLSQIKQGYF